VTAILFQGPELLGRQKVLTDFDAFHVAGTMAAQGRATDTYKAIEMIAAQRAVSDIPSFMPWTYPPPYTLAVKAFAHLPIGVGYLLFISASFAFYLLILRKLVGNHLPGVLIAVLPTVVLMVRTGQNGFLTGALIGWFLLALSDQRRSAGLPLGLMVIKPHLAAGIALLALLAKRWTAMAVAAAVVLASFAAATAEFGVEIWPAFLGGVREAGEFLAAGHYQLFRMTSVYAGARSFGATASFALSVHAMGAAAALALLIWIWRQGQSPRLIAASACAMSLFVSPYAYDYDLTILGVGIAFVLPQLVERASSWEMRGLLALCWFTTGYGLAVDVLQDGQSVTTGAYAGSAGYVSLAAPALIILVASAWIILQRQPAIPHRPLAF
jgi:hypothetical protein